MNIEHRTEGDIEIVRLPSRIMMADAKEMKKQLRALIEQRRPLLALDMSEVEYVDSSGLAVLVNTLRTSRRRSGDICLYALRDTVQALFELTRLHRVFPIEERHQQAVERLASC